jgi:hypothetical protein
MQCNPIQSSPADYEVSENVLLYKLLSKLYLCTTEKAKLNIIGDCVMNLKSVVCEGAKWVHMALDI